MITKSALSNANVTDRRSEDNRERARPRFIAVYRNLFLHKTQSFPPRRRCSITNEINTRRNLRRRPSCYFTIIVVLFTDACLPRFAQNYYPILSISLTLYVVSNLTAVDILFMFTIPIKFLRVDPIIENVFLSLYRNLIVALIFVSSRYCIAEFLIYI